MDKPPRGQQLREATAPQAGGQRAGCGAGAARRGGRWGHQWSRVDRREELAGAPSRRAGALLDGPCVLCARAVLDSGPPARPQLAVRALRSLGRRGVARGGRGRKSGVES